MDTRDFIIRFLFAITNRDTGQLAAMLHPDFVTEIPQSGERTRGPNAFIAELHGYPGGGPEQPLANEVHVAPDEDRWAMSPGYTVVPLASPNDFTVTFRIRYPDGRWWHVVGLIQMRDERLYRMTNYFAPELPAPLAESIATYQHG